MFMWVMFAFLSCFLAKVVFLLFFILGYAFKLILKQDALKKAIMILQDAESSMRFNVVSDRNPERANELFMAITKNIEELKNGLADIENHGGINNLANDEELFNILTNEEMFENAEYFRGENRDNISVFNPDLYADNYDSDIPM